MEEKEKVGGCGARETANSIPSCKCTLSVHPEHFLWSWWQWAPLSTRCMWHGAGGGCREKQRDSWTPRELLGSGCEWSLAKELKSGQLSEVTSRAANMSDLHDKPNSHLAPNTSFHFCQESHNISWFSSLASDPASAWALANFLFSYQQKLYIICSNQSFLTLTFFSLPI